jgi:hypothetical protein
MACLGALVFANTYTNEPTISQPKYSSTPAPVSRPNVPAASRGQLLYENHCLTCHDSSVHIRQHDKARSLADIRRWVVRWAQHLKLDWTNEEISDVTNYLNQIFYDFSDE